MYGNLNVNMALAMFPLSAFGGGAIVLPWEGAQWTVSVLDPSGTAGNNNINEAFADGVAVATEGRTAVKPFGLVGHQTLGAAWSNKDYLSIKQDPSNIARLLAADRFPRLGDPGTILHQILAKFFPGLLVPTQPPAQVSSTWVVYYNADQYLWSPEGHPDRGIGMFGRFGVTDGQANPIKYSYNLGIGGNGIVPGRLFDNFGIAWSRVVFSDNFIPFLRQNLNLGLEHEDAIELYYDASVTRWLRASLDLQIIDPGLNKTLNSSGQLENTSKAVVIGLRVYARF